MSSSSGNLEIAPTKIHDVAALGFAPGANFQLRPEPRVYTAQYSAPPQVGSYAAQMSLIPVPHLMMSDPAHYEIKPPAPGKKWENKFAEPGYKKQQADRAKFRAVTQWEWDRLRYITEALRIAGPVLHTGRACNNGLFAADASFTLRKKTGELVTVFSKYTNVERRHEIDVHEAFFRAQKKRGHVMIHSPHPLEGTGDNRHDPSRGIILSAYAENPDPNDPSAGRSSLEGHRFLEQATGVPVFSYKAEGELYHSDTSTGPLALGHVLAAPKGMTPEDFERFQVRLFDDYGLSRRQYLVAVPDNLADWLVCNTINAPLWEPARLRDVKERGLITAFPSSRENYNGTAVLMPEPRETPDQPLPKEYVEFRAHIADLGYAVLSSPMMNTIDYGGAYHCSVNNIAEVDVPGGYLRKMGIVQRVPK